MRRLAVLLLAATGCAMPAPAETAPAAAAPPDPSIAYWRLHIDTRDRGIGAYTISIRWNADVASIEEILPCSPRYFKGSPEYDPASFRTGQTRITSLDVFGSRPKSGQWHLFTIVFRRKAAGTVSASATLEKLYDDENKPFQGKLIDTEFKHDFP